MASEMKLKFCAVIFIKYFLIASSTCYTAVFAEVNFTEPSTPSVLDSISQDAQSNVIVPKPANCMPELQVVQFKENIDPSTIYFPNCVRIKRCGGCCTSELVSCQPTTTETRNYRIHGNKLGSGGKFEAFSEIVPLEEHTACKCDCKIKEKDCTDKQIYEKGACKCICPNFDESNKCQQQYAKKLWNSARCSCECREIQACSTGNVFDENSCSCKRQD